MTQALDSADNAPHLGLRFTQQPGSLGGNCLQSSEESHWKQREPGRSGGEERRKEGEDWASNRKELLEKQTLRRL